MFEEVAGIPAHPLLVHAAVVFVPLLAIGAIVYAVVPRLRDRVGWVVALLIPAGVGSAFLARASGEAFEKRLAARGTVPEFLDQIGEHGDLAMVTWWLTLVLGLVAAALLLLTRWRPEPGTPGGRAAPVVRVLLTVAAVGLAVASLYYVVRTGDSGAKLVWSRS